MKNLYKILLSSVIIIIINLVTQTPSYSHGLQGLLSTISFFSKANASDHTAEKEVIKELKIKIYNLGSEPLKRKNLFQSDKKWIVDLKKQIKDLEKKNSINALQSKIEREIEELGGKPITKVTEIDRDDQTIALKKQLEKASLAGINDVIIDPGFGFGKNKEHNFELIKNLSYLKTLNCPILVGVSRKSMIYKTLGFGPNQALNGTTVLNALSLDRGAKILRVHDVREAKECIDLWSELQ